MEQTLRQRAEALLSLARKADDTPWFSPANYEFKTTSHTKAPYLAQKLIEALNVLKTLDNRGGRGSEWHKLIRQFLEDASE